MGQVGDLAIVTYSAERSKIAGLVHSIYTRAEAGPVFYAADLPSAALSVVRRGLVSGPEYSAELVNSRTCPQSWQTPSLIGPFGTAITQWWAQWATTYSATLLRFSADGTTPRYTQSWAVLSGTSSPRAKSRTVSPFPASQGFNSTMAAVYYGSEFGGPRGNLFKKIWTDTYLFSYPRGRRTVFHA